MFIESTLGKYKEHERETRRMRRVNQAIKEKQQRFEKRLATWIEREQSNADLPTSDEQI